MQSIQQVTDNKMMCLPITSVEEVNQAVKQYAFDDYRKIQNSIADFLEQIAIEIVNLGDALLENVIQKRLYRLPDYKEKRDEQ
jgi:hypothetical protein